MRIATHGHLRTNTRPRVSLRAPENTPLGQRISAHVCIKVLKFGAWPYPCTRPLFSPHARGRGQAIQSNANSLRAFSPLVVGIYRDVTRLNGVHLNPTADPTPLALPRRRRGTRAPVQALAAKVRACRAAAVAVARCAFSRAAPAPARGAGRLACMAQLNGRPPPLPRGPACPARPSKTCSRATNRGEERSGRKRARGRADAPREPEG